MGAINAAAKNDVVPPINQQILYLKIVFKLINFKYIIDTTRNIITTDFGETPQIKIEIPLTINWEYCL